MASAISVDKNFPYRDGVSAAAVAATLTTVFGDNPTRPLEGVTFGRSQWLNVDVLCGLGAALEGFSIETQTNPDAAFRPIYADSKFVPGGADANINLSHNQSTGDGPHQLPAGEWSKVRVWIAGEYAYRIRAKGAAPTDVTLAILET